MIDWDDSILVGIATVDSDHKDILDHINRFVAEIEAGSNTVTVHDAFRAMEHRIHRHLYVEERMLESFGFGDAADHKATHAGLVDDLEAIWDDMLADPQFRPDAAARQWLETWLFDHVRSEDFRYCDWIVDAGLEAEAEHLMNE